MSDELKLIYSWTIHQICRIVQLMMDLGGMMSELSKDQKKLIKLLKKIKNDYDYILGTLLDVEHPDDTRELINFIEQGEDVNPNSVAAYSIYLSNEREAP